ncbi:hypothetical protein JCM10449v2_004061 [Rhodotorula kratochvilovae]
MEHYGLRAADYTILEGEADRPFLGILHSFDENIASDRQLARAARLDNVRKMAGPALLGAGLARGNARSKMPIVAHQFIKGELGKGRPYQIDTDGLGPMSILGRTISTGTHEDPRRDRRTTWQFLSPDPRATPLDALVVSAHHTDPLEEDGALRPDSTPATFVEWLLETEIPGEPLAVFKLVFHRAYQDAVARAWMRFRQLQQQGPNSLAKSAFEPMGRGTARTNTLGGEVW